MVVRARASEEIEADAELPPGLQELGVEMVRDLARRAMLLLGPHRDRGSMLVGPRNHENVVAEQPIEAGENIGGQIRAGDLPDVQRAVRVRPRDANQHLFWHSGPPWKAKIEGKKIGGLSPLRP